jgi:hypothetical protein
LPPLASIQAILAASRVATANDQWNVLYGLDRGTPFASSFGQRVVNNTYETLNPGVTDDYAALRAVYDPASQFASELGSLPTGTTVESKSLNVGASYNGSSWNYWSNSWLTAKLPAYLETSSNFLKATLKTSFTATGITGLPAMGVSAVVARDTLKGGTAAFTLTWGADAYTFTVSVVDASLEKSSITITNTQGVRLTLQGVTLDGSSGSGSLYVGTAKVGDVATMGKGIIKVTYSDGTFESFQ